MDLEDLPNTSGEEDGELCMDSEEEEEGLHFSGEEVPYGTGTTDRDFGIASCQTLTPDLISKKMFEIIKEVNEVFQVGKDIRGYCVQGQ